jgi:hypothetical protein
MSKESSPTPSLENNQISQQSFIEEEKEKPHLPPFMYFTMAPTPTPATAPQWPEATGPPLKSSPRHFTVGTVVTA